MYHFISLVALATIATPASIPVEATLSEVSLVQFQQEQTTVKTNFQPPLDLNPPKLNLEATKEATPAEAPIGSDYKSQITYWCDFYGCNPNTVYKVMMCESKGNVNAMNGIHTSLFQFNPKTFHAYALKAGITNPDIRNPSHQIQTATRMFANGGASHWKQCL